jgi:hypothetical protein
LDRKESKKRRLEASGKPSVYLKAAAQGGYMAYKGSVTRMENLSRLVLFLVMLTLAGFLSALSNKVLEDVNQWVAAPAEESCE